MTVNSTIKKEKEKEIIESFWNFQKKIPKKIQ